MRISSKRRLTRLSKISWSSSVGDGGGVSIEVVVVVPSVVPAIIVVGVRVVGFGCSTLPFVVSMFSVSGFPGFLGSPASFGEWGVFRGFTVGFPLASGHIGRG